MKREQMDAIKVAINGRFECEHWHAGICDDCWEWVGSEIGSSMNSVEADAHAAGYAEGIRDADRCRRAASDIPITVDRARALAPAATKEPR